MTNDEEMETKALHHALTRLEPEESRIDDTMCVVCDIFSVLEEKLESS